MKQVPLAPQPCPSCGTEFDRVATNLHHIVPMQGDITVCFHCAEILVFEGADLQARLLRADELAQLPQAEQTNLARMSELLRAARRP
jgi:uncharacterized membrane protein